MKTISCNNKEFKQIKNNTQIYKVFNNIELKYLEKCILVNDNMEKINIQITSVKEYSNIDDVLNIINLEKFGIYKDNEEFVDFIKKYYDINNKFIVCRIKNLDDNNTEIEDKNLIKLIKLETLNKQDLGLSGCFVYNCLTTDNKKAILKIQNISSNDTLEEEFKVLKYVFKKIRSAKPYYYNKVNGKEYLLREYFEGEPLYKYNNFGYKLGQELKQIHSNYNEDCEFNKFCTENLLNNALKNIDIVYETRIDFFKDYSKDDLIKYLKDNKPEDDALIHGDFSLTNILMNKNDYYYIDLGNLSISTKYFDIYVLKKSLIINNLIDEYEEFLKGYDIKIDEKYLNWMSLIEASYN